MGACPLASFRTGWLPGPFPTITCTSLTILNTSSPLWFSGFVWWSVLPLKCLPLFLRAWFNRRNQRWPMYTTFRYFFKNITSRSSKQCAHALYPVFDYPKRLLRANQSLIVTNNNARRSKCSYLYSSHTHMPMVLHNYKSFSTNGLRYTSMLFLGCFGP
jgi:hypothetical protein